jgi:hypothetical protein
MRSKSLSLLAVLLTAAILVSTAFAQTQKSGSGGAVAEVTRLEQEDVKADLANDPSFVKQYCAEVFRTLVRRSSVASPST